MQLLEGNWNSFASGVGLIPKIPAIWVELKVLHVVIACRAKLAIQFAITAFSICYKEKQPESGVFAKQIVV